MSPRDTFWFLAGALAALAIMVTVRAWVRKPAAAGPQTQPAAPASASGRKMLLDLPVLAVPLAAALALVAIALGIYFLIGSPDSIAAEHAASAGASEEMPRSAKNAGTTQSSANAGSLEEVTGKLAARLAATGGSDDDWRLLAQSYEYMGRTEEAQAARMHLAAAESSTASATAAPARISGKVEISAKLAGRAPVGTTLFVYAKQPDAPGPPLAVLRLRVEHWPVSFALDDTNSMVPGRILSNAKTVRLEARISNSGDALPRSGDLVGSISSVDPHGGHAVIISIDHEIR